MKTAIILLALIAMASATVLLNGGAYSYNYPYVGSRLSYGLPSTYYTYPNSYSNSYYYPGYRYNYVPSVPSVPLVYDWLKK